MKQKIIQYLLPALIAAIAFFTGAVTDLGDAVQIALDKEKSAQTYKELVQPTPAE